MIARTVADYYAVAKQLPGVLQHINNRLRTVNCSQVPPGSNIMNEIARVQAEPQNIIDEILKRFRAVGVQISQDLNLGNRKIESDEFDRPLSDQAKDMLTELQQYIDQQGVQLE